MAQSLFTEALTAVQQIGDRRQEALLLSNLASTHSSSGEGHEALAVSA